MAKFYDIVGFLKTEESSSESHPGVYAPIVEERLYKGEILEDSRRWTNTGEANSSFSLSNRVSIITDKFSYDNCFAIRYVKYNGAYWEVTSVKIQRPRLILTLGGVYNGPTAETSRDICKNTLE